MKIAVVRYSLSLQTELDSKVGGGRLTSAVLTALKQQGHDVTVVCKAGANTTKWIEDQGIGYEPEAASLADYGGMVVLTGPRNSLYGKSLCRTYKLLATLPEGARAAYCQWDTALPFAFRPEYDAGLRKAECHSSMFNHLDWTLLAQEREENVRSKGGVATAYKHARFRYRRCLFELEEYRRDEVMPVSASVEQRFAYFGSDRPGRLREFRRWFCAPDSPPVDVFGVWSTKNKQLCSAPNVRFLDPVPEGSVRSRLNGYLATLYMADPAYIKHDFIAQRFFENAMAGVVTLYSDKLQPSVDATVPEALKMNVSAPLRSWYEMLTGAPTCDRQRLADLNRESVERVVEGSPHKLQARLKEVFS